MSIIKELEWRELLYDKTESVADLLSAGGATVYTGFDPTGDSLHVGSLVPIICLARLQRAGHKPIALAGGGTGMIGDPSGKVEERKLLTKDQVEYNLNCIRNQLERFLDFNSSNAARIVNNGDWLSQLSFVDFLRDTGKHFTINYMMAKESVRARIEREDGISFTEFSYMLLQAYDFYHLFKEYGCNVQAGGSDQWGNITTGIELVRRLTGKKAYGIVYPLITKADGSKFGKTESGNIWLDPNKTSPYQFYQFWRNSDDADVIRYLKYFTFLSKKQIDELDRAVAEQPEKREAQVALARELTLMLHDKTGLSAAENATKVLFGGSMEGLGANEIADIFTDVPSSEFPKDAFSGGGKSIVDVLKDTGMAKSKGEAKRMLGGVYLNNNKITDELRLVNLDDSIEGKFIVLRHGRKKYHLIKLSQ